MMDDSILWFSHPRCWEGEDRFTSSWIKPVELVKLKSCYVETMYGTHIQDEYICNNIAQFLKFRVVIIFR